MRSTILLRFIFIVSVVLFTLELAGQEQPDADQELSQVRSVITKNDNSRYIGVIIFEDAREVIIRTENLGEVAIPKHEIREIREVQPGDFRDDHFVGEEMFATRYFLTTNGLPVRRGDDYVQWNLFGPDFQFAVADNFGIGVMTSWIAMPIIGTAKRSWQLGENTSMALGGLLGTGSWTRPDLGLILPFVAFTSGNRSNNINFSTGYGRLFYAVETYNWISDRTITEKFREGRLMFSVAGMAKISPVISLVFDSFIMTRGPERTQTEFVYNWETDTMREIKTKKRSSGLAVFVPGIRWQTKPNSAFQFGFTGIRYEGEFVPAPLPMVQWYRKL